VQLVHTEEVAPPSGGPKACVPFLFHQMRETNEKWSSTTIGQQVGEAKDLEYRRCPSTRTPDNSQICEGTNQVQRMVMARQLLK
jgi:hypothetical protein